MDYNIAEDLKIIREILELTQAEIAKEVGVKKLTILRIENGENKPSDATTNKIYDFAYSKGIKINHIKEMFYREEINNKVVFHGSKSIINGPISHLAGRNNSDFGRGFYCGESLEQVISFIARFPDSCLYMIELCEKDLKELAFKVDQEWMLAIAYYRGKINQYKDHPLIRKIINKVESADCIYAPIADNRMFSIIDQFIDGLITDEQCKHCLAATNLGCQYVFLNEKATSMLSILERCYISKLEREHFQNIKGKENILRRF